MLNLTEYLTDSRQTEDSGSTKDGTGGVIIQVTYTTTWTYLSIHTEDSEPIRSEIFKTEFSQQMQVEPR